MSRQVPARNGGTLTVPDKGEVMNPNGRPPKLIKHVNNELVKAGFKPASKSDINEAILILMQLGYAKMKEITDKDTNYPFFYKFIAKELLGKNGQKIMNDVLNRAIGMPSQAIDHTTGGEKLIIALPPSQFQKNDIPTTTTPDEVSSE